jgi:hypothetical protein
VVAGDHFGAGLADRQSVLEPGPLPALHRRILSYRAFVARQWGVYFVGPLVVGRYDPLGLVFAQREVARIDPFEVYPAAARIEVAALVGGRASVAARDVTAAAAGESLLFAACASSAPGRRAPHPCAGGAARDGARAGATCSPAHAVPRPGPARGAAQPEIDADTWSGWVLTVDGASAGGASRSWPAAFMRSGLADQSSRRSPAGGREADGGVRSARSSSVP